jgi:broad specificity phosphatase PhoE
MDSRDRVTDTTDPYYQGGSAVTVELVYETHATTTDNEAGIATGWLPGELSPTGREQARRLGERHRGDSVAAVFSSDLRRAVETAEIAFGGQNQHERGGPGAPVLQEVRLRECNYGTLNGAPVAEVAAQRRERIETPFPDGESYLQVVTRTRSFLADLVRDWDGRRVVVVAHSANLWALEAIVYGRRLADLVDAPFAWQPGWLFHVDRADPTPDPAYPASSAGDAGGAMRSRPGI